jgi:hypothetical protein
MSASIQIVGIAWYRRGDWAELRALFTDADLLPDFFDDWERIARQAEQQAQRAGKTVVRAEIRPRHFAEWCRATGRQPDAKARMDWANERAVAEHRKRH